MPDTEILDSGRPASTGVGGNTTTEQSSVLIRSPTMSVGDTLAFATRPPVPTPTKHRFLMNGYRDFRSFGPARRCAEIDADIGRCCRDQQGAF